MLEIIFFIEEQLGVKVKDDEMIPDNLDSVDQIASFDRAASSRRRSATVADSMRPIHPPWRISLQPSAARTPDAEAVVHGSRRVTYAARGACAR